MSNNTNTLFWVITGAVIVLSIFTLVNVFHKNNGEKINDNFGSTIKDTIDNGYLVEHYGHEPNFTSLKVTSEDDFIFDAETGTITSYIGTNPDVVIPATIGGVEVKTIGTLNLKTNYNLASQCEELLDKADFASTLKKLQMRQKKILVDDVCYDRVLLNSVVIPDTVEFIEDSAFANNGNLKKITLPRSIRLIGGYAFSGNQLEKVDLSNLKKLGFLGSYAFANNKITGHVTIPEKVVNIGNYIYSGNDIKSADILLDIETLPLYIFDSNPNMEYVKIKSKNMRFSDLLDGVECSFNQDSDFTIKVPKGTLEWYRSFPALDNYRMEEY